MYYTALVTKASCNWHKNKDVDQCNRRRTPKQIHVALPIWSLKKASTIYIGEKIVSLTSGAEKNEYAHVEEWNLIPTSHSVQK